MKGLDLARSYYQEIVFPEFRRAAPDVLSEMAFGLVGAGSECYGFDDHLSRDHDWGPRVCIWVPEAVYREHGARLQSVYDHLDSVFEGFGPVRRLDTRVARDGVMSVADFYRRHLGTEELPKTLRDWLLLPEEALSEVTNGEVFADYKGAFTAKRQGLLEYFPRDLWLKKIASRCRETAQNGQYNLWRAIQRGDKVGAHHHLAAFCRGVATLVFLLARTYRPFDKWLFRGMQELGEPGRELHNRIEHLVTVGDEQQMRNTVEEIAQLLAEALVDHVRVQIQGSFLWDYARPIEELIENTDLRDRIGRVA